MTSALIALVFLVVWYGGMLLAFWLIDRQIDDPASPEGRREKTFAMILIGLGAGVVLWGGIGPLTALAYRIDTIRPMVAQCRAGGEAEVCADLARAVERFLSKPEVAHAVLGAIQSADTAERIDIANSGALGKVVLASQKLDNPEFPGAKVRTPVLLACDAADEKAYMEERFGPISFIVKVADTAAGIALSERVVRTHGALTVGLYSTKQDVIDAMTEATWRGKVALSINLTSGVFVNQSAAFSDYHGTGGNPSANASYSDSAFVANRFRVVQRRHHV